MDTTGKESIRTISDVKLIPTPGRVPAAPGRDRATPRQLREQRISQAEQFLAELGRGIPDTERVMAGYADEATVQMDSTGKKLNSGWWPVPWKAGKYINDNANCYACISSSIKTPNPKTGALRYWRGEASFGHGLALMVDDIGQGAGSKGDFTLHEFAARLPPTAVVETSPGNYQFWYFLDKPEPDMAKFKAFLGCFVSNVLAGKGGDWTVKDVSRYGRMPCGINNKRHTDGTLKYPVTDAKGRAQPFAVRLVDALYTNRYSPEEIASAFGFRIIVPRPAATPRRHAPGTESETAKWNRELLRLAVGALNGTGEGSGGTVQENTPGKYRIRCPWGAEHANGDPYGAYFRGPVAGAEIDYVFGCSHDTCKKAERKWTAFVNKVVLPYLCEKLEEAAEWSDQYEAVFFTQEQKETDRNGGASTHTARSA